MKNIRHLTLASKGHGTTINSAAQQQNIRHNNQYYGLTAKVIVRQNEKAMAYFVSPLSLSLSLSLATTPSLSLSLSLSLSTHIHMDGWVGDIGEEGKKGQVEKADSHRTQCG